MLSRRQTLSLAVAPLLAAQQARKLKIVVAGGHPGDPECGCGGTIARCTDAGHDVVILYLNRGEGYCQGAKPSECASVRAAEATKACQLLKARAAFLTQVDGKAIVDEGHYAEAQRFLNAEKPDVVFTQWSIDTHRDHRAISTLVLDAWLQNGKKFALYYYEVAEDTQMFTPTEFIDITAVEGRRRAACYAHVSQSPDKWYPKQVELTRFRGTQSGHAQAEAFARHWESRSVALP